MESTFKEVLLEIGYSNIIDNGRELRTRPIYRESSNYTSLSIDKRTGRFKDFGGDVRGSFEELVKLSLGLKSLNEAKKWLDGKYVLQSVRAEKPKIKQPRKLNVQDLQTIEKDHSYWVDRGISAETLDIFEGGVMKEGRFKNRYVFPVFNHRKELVGMSGRDLQTSSSSMRPKWKHIGDKSKWKYPLQINSSLIYASKDVILVESIGDALALWDYGCKNLIVTFGLDISVELLNLFIKYNLNKITISFNNDLDNNAGNKAAEKACKKLLKYFDKSQVGIKLPTKNDFGEMSKSEISQWLTKI
jgi:hypothetical protein